MLDLTTERYNTGNSGRVGDCVGPLTTGSSKKAQPPSGIDSPYVDAVDFFTPHSPVPTLMQASPLPIHNKNVCVNALVRIWYGATGDGRPYREQLSDG